MPKSILKSNSAFVGIGNPLSSPKTIQRTNLVKFSEQFDLWDKAGTNQPTITSIDTNGPFGTKTAEKVTFGTSADSRLQQGIAAMSAGTYIFSIWLRADSPVTMRIGTTTGGTTINVTTQWQRFSNTRTVTAGTLYPQIQKHQVILVHFHFMLMVLKLSLDQFQQIILKQQQLRLL